MKNEQLMLDLEFVDSNFEILIECVKKSIEKSPDKDNIIEKFLAEINKYNHLLTNKDLTRISKIYL